MRNDDDDAIILTKDMGYLVMKTDGTMSVNGLTTRDMCFFSHLIHITIHAQLLNDDPNLAAQLKKGIKKK